MYALFVGNLRIGKAYQSEKEAWEKALADGLVADIPVADEEGGQILPLGCHVERVPPEDHALPPPIITPMR